MIWITRVPHCIGAPSACKDEEQWGRVRLFRNYGLGKAFAQWGVRMDLEEIYQKVIEGAHLEVEKGVKELLDRGASPVSILYESLIPAMDEVGGLFERHEFFVPEMLVAARAMQAGMNVLKPLLVESGVDSIGRMVIGTVKGDLHDIGKNLVAMMLEGAGFEIIDLGVDVPAEKFVEVVISGVDFMGMSALLTTTMSAMKDIIQALEDSHLRDQVKIVVGGAPVTQEYADSIGADGYAADASAAVNLVRRLLG
jgi:5-methyltetrahydrofolate--homocysteine methyltransferase